MDVLVYVDPSPRGEWALTIAAQLPRAANLTLLATSEDVSAHPRLLERALSRLAPLAARALARPGPAEQAVVGEAAAHDWGLLVVPPAGRGALARMLRGSRVATVVRAARAPVLVARRPPERLTRILAAVSGRASSPSVIAAALAWGERLAAAVSFVHVASEVALPSAAAGVGRGDPDPGLERVRSLLRAHGREAELIVREGFVVDELLDSFDAGAHQLLVVGARDGASDGFGREDVTERLLLGCPGSTLIVPRPEP